ncbi:MAG: AAA family ATPase [Clostridia bacterium]|nr:AAA family ATPase [Clostridia bacterium]
MIIKKADIEGFGKFTNKSLEFDRGFNLIVGANEDGKTTFMSFIKMMFYSSSGKTEKGQDLLKIPRKKYRPWNGTPMSGAVEFETRGMEYRLRKEFLKSEASDKTTVFCKTSSEEQKIENPNEAGEYFFNMNLGDFERSVFIGSNGGFSSDASADSLAMRISNLSVSGDENTSQDLITKRLSDAIEELVSKSGKKGLLVDAEAELDKLNFELQELLQQTELQKSLFEEIADIEKAIAEKEEILKDIANRQKIASAKKELNAYYTLNNKINLRENINKQLSKYGKTIDQLKEHINHAEKLEQEISLSVSALEEISAAPNTKEVSETEFGKADTLDKLATQIRGDLETLRKKVFDAKSALDNITQKAFKKSKATAPVLFFIFAAIAAGIAFAGFTTRLAFLYALGGTVFAIGTTIALVFSRILPRKVQEKPAVQFAKRDLDAALRSLACFNEEMVNQSINEIESSLNSKLSDTVSELEDILTLHNCANLAELKEKTSTAKAGELSAITTKLNNQKEEFTLFMAQLKPLDSFVAAKILFNEITDSFNTLSNISTDIETISTATGIQDTSEAYVTKQIKTLASFLQNTPETEVNEESTAGIENTLKELRSRLGECQSRINLPKKSEDELNTQIHDAQLRKNELKIRFDELSIANEVMTEAISETNKGLGSHLSKKTGEYLNKLSGGRYNDVLVSRSLNVEARGGYGEAFHEWKYLSGGAIDRIYLALRLAATDILTGNEPLPLFLDDILSQYDDESCKRTLEFLKDYLESNKSTSQILFFTCHGYIADMAKSIFPDLRKISL